MLLAPGDTFERYTIESHLGGGGLGNGYYAFDTRLRRRVALKVLRADLGDRTHAAHRLMREARVAAALDHPNAVAIFDVGEVDGVAYLAMELIEGKPLRAFIGDARVSLDQRVRWLTDIARALAAAHERGLVHRDLKPENVLLRNDGVVKVLDFGLASSEPDGALRGLAKADGTFEYMAPEQVNAEPSDARADQFAWGVVAYELLAGCLPWKDGDFTRGPSTRDPGTLRSSLRMMTLGPRLLSELAPELAASVVATVHKALATAPRDRFMTMDEIVHALEPHGAPSIPKAALASTLPPPPQGFDPTLPSGGGLTPISSTRNATPKKSATRTFALVASALVAIGTLAFFALHRAAAPSPSSASLAASPSGSGASTLPSARSSAAAIAITDLPIPKSARPDAATAYLGGLQAIRDASLVAGVQSLEHAIDLDPSLAAAHLRLAWWNATRAPAEARAHFQRATQMRWSLDERDQALLNAIEPYASRDPADLAETAKRMADVAARYPNDAELAFYLGRHRQTLGDLDGASSLMDRALALDPKFALAYWAKGTLFEDRTDMNGALVAYNRCLEISSAAASCLRSRAMIHAQRGACVDLEADTRRMIVIEPSGHRAFDFLARALFARGRPIETVREALRQKWDLYPPGKRAARELYDRAQLDLATGDFVSAERRAKELERLVEAATTDLEHAEAANQLLDVYAETGRTDRAADVADAFLKRRDVWIATSPIGENPVQAVVPRLLAVSARGGRITAADFETKRDAWLTDSQARISPLWAKELWYSAYASITDDEASARAALAVLPRFSPLPPGRDFTMADAATGRAYLLAGDAASALPYLERGASTCLAFDAPVVDTQAHLQLGDALRITGDIPRACTAYRVVVDRWGSAKPRSISAEQARAHMTELACPRAP